jgi:hypothetical protein
MHFTNLEDLLARRRALRLSEHALKEAHKEGLRAKDVFRALFNGEVIEHYPDRDRILVLGSLRRFNLPVHIVCDYGDADVIVAVTVYIPSLAKWGHVPVRRRRPNVLSPQHN